jgi:hypothetical protein
MAESRRLEHAGGSWGKPPCNRDPRDSAIKQAKPAKKSVRGSIKRAGWDNSFLQAILVAG